MQALYAPLTPGNNGEFPLHCDMYIPKRLFNVFDDVPDDDSGASAPATIRFENAQQAGQSAVFVFVTDSYYSHSTASIVSS